MGLRASLLALNKALAEINAFSKETGSLRDNYHPPRPFLIDHLWREEGREGENQREGYIDLTHSW